MRSEKRLHAAKPRTSRCSTPLSGQPHTTTNFDGGKAMRTQPMAASSLAVSALLTATLAAPAVQAADSQPTKVQSAGIAHSPSYTLDIPAGDLNSALQELALA